MAATHHTSPDSRYSNSLPPPSPYDNRRLPSLKDLNFPSRRLPPLGQENSSDVPPHSSTSSTSGESVSQPQTQPHSARHPDQRRRAQPVVSPAVMPHHYPHHHTEPQQQHTPPLSAGHDQSGQKLAEYHSKQDANGYLTPGTPLSAQINHGGPPPNGNPAIRSGEDISHLHPHKRARTSNASASSVESPRDTRPPPLSYPPSHYPPPYMSGHQGPPPSPYHTMPPGPPVHATPSPHNSHMMHHSQGQPHIAYAYQAPPYMVQPRPMQDGHPQPQHMNYGPVHAVMPQHHWDSHTHVHHSPSHHASTPAPPSSSSAAHHPSSSSSSLHQATAHPHPHLTHYPQAPPQLPSGAHHPATPTHPSTQHHGPASNHPPRQAAHQPSAHRHPPASQPPPNYHHSTNHPPPNQYLPSQPSQPQKVSSQPRFGEGAKSHHYSTPPHHVSTSLYQSPPHPHPGPPPAGSHAYSPSHQATTHNAHSQPPHPHNHGGQTIAPHQTSNSDHYAHVPSQHVHPSPSSSSQSHRHPNLTGPAQAQSMPPHTPVPSSAGNSAPSPLLHHPSPHHYHTQQPPPLQPPPPHHGSHQPTPQAPVPTAPQTPYSALVRSAHSEAYRSPSYPQYSSSRDALISEIVKQCTVLYHFAGRFAHLQNTMPQAQPSPMELNDMVQRANQVVQMLDELKRHCPEENRSTVSSPTTARDDQRQPKRPWEDLSEGSNEREAQPPPSSFPDAHRSPVEKKPVLQPPPNPSPVPAAVPTASTPVSANPTAAEQDMEMIRSKRATSTAAAAAAAGVNGQAKTKYRKRSRASPPGKCHSCNIRETPEWRRGPDGARTLCNACGLHYAKLMRKQERHHGSHVPAIDMETLRASARAAEQEKSKTGGNKGNRKKGQGTGRPQPEQQHPQPEQQQQTKQIERQPMASQDDSVARQNHHQGSFQIIAPPPLPPPVHTPIPPPPLPPPQQQTTTSTIAAAPPPQWSTIDGRGPYPPPVTSSR